MKAFNGYDQAKEAARQTGSGAKLPPGAYKAKIIGVKYEQGKNGTSDRILIQFDITEGEFKDFFRTQYDENTSEDKKWKGRTNIFIPKDDGSEKDSYTKKAFAGWTSSFEKSNNGYVWDWDETKWVDKLVGIVFGETGTVIEGKEVVYTEPRFAVEVEKVRDGKAPEAKFKAKNGYKGTSASSAPISDTEFMTVSAGVREELPF